MTSAIVRHIRPFHVHLLLLFISLWRPSGVCVILTSFWIDLPSFLYRRPYVAHPISVPRCSWLNGGGCTMHNAHRLHRTDRAHYRLSDFYYGRSQLLSMFHTPESICHLHHINIIPPTIRCSKICHFGWEMTPNSN